MKTFIVLLPVGTYDRVEDANLIENEIFEDAQEFINKVAKSGIDRPKMKILALTNFMDEFNNEEIDNSKYWLTYVHFKQSI